MEVKRDHVEIVDAQVATSHAINSVVSTDHWMIAVWAVKDGKIQLVDRTTWGFPTGDFPAAVELLKSSCQKEMGTIETLKPIEPLPLAVLGELRFNETGDEDCTEEDQFV